MNKVPLCKSKEEMIKFFEALYYEQKIRVTEKKKLLDQLDAVVDQTMNQFKTAENMIKRLHYEVKLFR